MKTVSIVDARVKLAAVLAPVEDGDPDVQANIVDAIVPPALICGWLAPMVDGPFTGCTAFGNLFVTLVADRLDAASGVEAIESMYDRVQRLLRNDGAGWSLQGDSGIGAFDIGNTPYLACRIELRVPVTL